MNKKFLSLVLALVMVLGTFGSVFAETKAPEAKDAKKSEVPATKETKAKVQWLIDNGIVAGRTVNKDDKNADLALDKDIQRAEVTKLLIYAIGQQDLAKRLNGVYAPYKDVAANHWANGVIAAGSTVASPANALPFLHGVGHNMFEPERQVRYDELAKMLVVLVKEDLTKAGLEAAKWPTDWMNWAAKLGIFDGLNTPVDGSKAAVREDAFVMIYNALYKLKNITAYPANETMGIISDASFNKITLNQGDFKKEFTVTASTNFVPGNYDSAKRDVYAINWYNAYKTLNETYYLGSLVRVLADEKGNVTHIIQLGNPEKTLACEGNGWEGVATDVAETLEKVELKTLSKLVLTNANTYNVEKKTTATKQTVEVNTTSATRYFVADNTNGVLTEVKDKAALLALFDRDRLTTNKGVYVGYDVLPNSGVKNARVVVLHDVDEDMYGKELVRIVTGEVRNHKLEAQKPGETATKVEKFDLAQFKAGFPYAKYATEDVVKLGAKDGERIIDRQNDNIYEIVDVDRRYSKGRELSGSRIVTLELKGEGTKTGLVDIDEKTDVFFGDQLVKGRRVQLTLRSHNMADVVSVLSGTPAVKGYLPAQVLNQKDSREVKAVFVTRSKMENGISTIAVTLIDDNGNVGEQKTFEVRTTDANKDILQKVKAGDIITFNALGKLGINNYEQADKLAIVKTKVEQDKEAAQKELDALNIEKAVYTKGETPSNTNLTAQPALPAGVKATYTLQADNKKVDIKLEKDGATREIKDVLVEEAK